MNCSPSPSNRIVRDLFWSQSHAIGHSRLALVIHQGKVSGVETGMR